MTSPLLILAGIPAKSTGRKARYEFSYEGWDCQRIDAYDKDVGLQYCWDRVLAAISDHEEHGNSGVHILAFHKPACDFPEFKHQVTPYHRIVLMSMTVLGQLGRDMDAFLAAMNAQVAFEEAWRANVLPTLLSAPLLLPNQHFAISGRYRQIWDEATDVKEDVTALVALRKTIRRFEVEHGGEMGSGPRKQIGYKDDQKRLFAYNGDRHGRIRENERLCERWKFNYKMEEGFHYDVVPTDGKAMAFRCTDGVERTFHKHVNIYPYGYIRP